MEGHLRNLHALIFQGAVSQMFPVSAVASTDACLPKVVFQASSYESIGELAVMELERILSSILGDVHVRLRRNPATASSLRFAVLHESIGLRWKAQADPRPDAFQELLKNEIH